MLVTTVVSAQDQRAGTLKTVAGDVRLSHGATAHAAQEGGGVQQADRIVTGRDASATFTLKDGTVISVGPNSTLDLATVQFDTTTQEGKLMLSLLQGTIRVVTGWLGKLHPEQVKVVTPNFGDWCAWHRLYCGSAVNRFLKLMAGICAAGLLGACAPASRVILLPEARGQSPAASPLQWKSRPVWGRRCFPAPTKRPASTHLGAWR